MGFAIEVVVILVLIGINGLFALSELALVSARRARLAVLERKGVAGAGWRACWLRIHSVSFPPSRSASPW